MTYIPNALQRSSGSAAEELLDSLHVVAGHDLVLVQTTGPAARLVLKVVTRVCLLLLLELAGAGDLEALLQHPSGSSASGIFFPSDVCAPQGRRVGDPPHGGKTYGVTTDYRSASACASPRARPALTARLAFCSAFTSDLFFTGAMIIAHVAAVDLRTRLDGAD